jgi:hypothetical protein
MSEKVVPTEHQRRNAAFIRIPSFDDVFKLTHIIKPSMSSQTIFPYSDIRTLSILLIETLDTLYGNVTSTSQGKRPLGYMNYPKFTYELVTR